MVTQVGRLKKSFWEQKGQREGPHLAVDQSKGCEHLHRMLKVMVAIYKVRTESGGVS